MAAIASVTSYEYAAGTCTLRLVGELSPLSQVTGRPVLGRSRFHLQVQPDEMAGESGAGASQAVMFEASGREPQFTALADLVQTYVQRHLSASVLAGGGEVSLGGHTLQPVGLTRHRLTLVAPPEPPHVVELSTLQLSDLADALEQADGTLQILPDAASPQARRVRPRLPLWLGSVAAVGIAALLGNQLLTNTPPAVVLSPSEAPPPQGSTAQPPANRQPPTRESPLPPAGSDSTTAAQEASPPAAGEALPAPGPTAPPAPAITSGAAADSSASKAPPQPSAVAPAPTPQPPQTATPAPAPPPPIAARAGGRAARPDAEMAAEPSSAPASSDTSPAAPASPEAFEARSGIAASNATDSAPGWLEHLTRALEQQWRPPANLAAPLRYSLTLEPDGTVAALVPLNDFSATYQNTPTLPQPGTAIPGFVRDSATTVEVQFLPTGEVEVTPPVEVNP